MKSEKNIPAILILSLLLSITGPVTSIPILNPTVTAEAAVIKISKTNATLIKAEELKLKISGTNSKIKWSSSRPNIASVTSKGIVKAKKKGSAKITATINDKTYKCAISVETPRLSNTSLSLTQRSSYQLRIIGSQQKILWSSSNNAVATVSNIGKVTTKRTGNCTIYASIGKTKYKCQVAVNKRALPSSPNEELTPIPTQNPTQAPENISYVWLSATGKKYHRISNCGNMNPDKARRISLKEAIKKRYTKCNNCF